MPPPPGGPWTPPGPPPLYVTPANPPPVQIPTLPTVQPPRWMVSVDALWLERDVGSSIFLGSTQTEAMFSDDYPLSLQPGVRLQVGAHLNDRTAVEATYWGLQQWSTGDTIIGSVAGGNPAIPNPNLMMANTSFDAMTYNYGSRVDNVEINERLLLPSFNPFGELTWLWGFRYFRLADNFTLSGLDVNGDYENVTTATTNNLVGLQIGARWARGWNRLEFITEGKVGLMANFYTQNWSDSGTGLTTASASQSGTDFAALLEVSLTLRYHLNQYFALQAAYQAYWVSGLALGPQQLIAWDHSGNIGLDGFSVGLQTTW